MDITIQWLHLDKHLGVGNWKSVEGRFIVIPIDPTGRYDLIDALNKIKYRSFENSGEAREYAHDIVVLENRRFTK